MSSARHDLRQLFRVCVPAVAVFLLSALAGGLFFIVWLAALLAGAGLLLLRGRSLLVGVGLLLGCAAAFVAGVVNYE